MIRWKIKESRPS